MLSQKVFNDQMNTAPLLSAQAPKTILLNVACDMSDVYCRDQHISRHVMYHANNLLAKHVTVVLQDQTQ
jgi:hypothetical protein